MRLVYLNIGFCMIVITSIRSSPGVGWGGECLVKLELMSGLAVDQASVVLYPPNPLFRIILV